MNADPHQEELFSTVEICRIPDEITGMALRSFLVGAGIDVAIQVYQASFYGTVLNPGEGYWGKVLVPCEQEDKARRQVEAFWREFHGS